MSDARPDTPDDRPRLSPLFTGVAGRCPRCGKSSMFDGFLALKSRCPACGLDLSRADTGDGPAFFASFLGGFLLLGAGVWLQIEYDPPVWTYAIVLVLGAVLITGMIRPLKGLLTALQYANKAEQGRFES